MITFGGTPNLSQTIGRHPKQIQRIDSPSTSQFVICTKLRRFFFPCEHEGILCFIIFHYVH
jgi:hypothetical protein